MQVANLKTGQITTATIPDHPSGDAGLLHGIGWTPDESEVWESGRDSQVYIWDMSHNPMVPRLKEILTLHSAGPHWLTFTIKGDYGYVAPAKDSRSETEIFNVRTHKFVGVIESSEEMIEIDFVNGRVSQVGDQFGVGRARR
jgi:WD40 repeat protein